MSGQPKKIFVQLFQKSPKKISHFFLKKILEIPLPVLYWLTELDQSSSFTKELSSLGKTIFKLILRKRKKKKKINQEKKQKNMNIFLLIFLNVMNNSFNLPSGPTHFDVIFNNYVWSDTVVLNHHLTIRVMKLKLNFYQTRIYSIPLKNWFCIKSMIFLFKEDCNLFEKGLLFVIG